MDKIALKAIGRVLSPIDDTDKMPLGGQKAIIVVDIAYQEALLGIEENSHLWVLSWFHKAPRDLLRISALKVNPDLPEYGVFALRAFGRPNPIGLSLVQLERVEDNRLYVSGLDAIDGTPVLDIKPYFENDIIFSPRSSYIRGKSREIRQRLILKQALKHHQEECVDLWVAVRMASIAEDLFGKLNSEDLLVSVKGSPCLADCIQGISKARLANPPRFSYEFCAEQLETTWSIGSRVLTICLKDHFSKQQVQELPDEDLFILARMNR